MLTAFQALITSDLKGIVADQSVVDNYLKALNPIEKGIQDYVSKAKERDYLNPLAVSDLLQRATSILNSCLNQRREAQQLEIALENVVLQIVQSKRALTLLNSNAGITARRCDTTLKTVALARNADVASTASTMIQGHADDSLAKIAQKYFQDVPSGQALSISRLVVDQSAAEKVIEEGLKTIAKEITDHFANTLTADGSAYNYMQRLSKIKARYSDDIVEAYDVLCAVEVGILALFDNPRGLEALKEKKDLPPTGVLDYLIDWASGAIDVYEKATKLDGECEIAISLGKCQPFKTPDGPETDPVIGTGNFATGKASGHFQFQLPKSFFDDLSLTRVRIRSIGLGYFSPETKGVFNVKIGLPTMTFNGAQSLGPVFYTPMVNVGLSSDVPRTTFSRLADRSPIGDWRLDVEKYGSLYDNRSAVANIVLYLRLTAQPA